MSARGTLRCGLWHVCSTLPLLSCSDASYLSMGTAPTITTENDNARGLAVSSLGGGAITVEVIAPIGVAIALGGSGGKGTTFKVTKTDSADVGEIETLGALSQGINAASIGGGGGGQADDVSVTNSGDRIETQDFQSDAIRAVSIGGKGG